MPRFVSNAQLEVAGYTVTLGPHQWDFVDGTSYLERTIGATPYGVLHRQKYDIPVRHREVRFVTSSALMEQLHRLAILAAVSGSVVKFTPDTAVPGTFWWIVWPLAVTFTPVMDNREEIVLPLQEQSPGA